MNKHEAPDPRIRDEWHYRDIVLPGEGVNGPLIPPSSPLPGQFASIWNGQHGTHLREVRNRNDDGIGRHGANGRTSRTTTEAETGWA